MKVYAVNSGSYSDYKINAIFSTKEKAKEFERFVKGDYNEVEVYELDPPVADLLKRGYSIWRVHMLIDGTTEKCDISEIDNYSVSDVGQKSIWERTKASFYKGKGIQDILTSTVWAKTEKHAIKIVNEQRTQMIATGKWRDNT